MGARLPAGHVGAVVGASGAIGTAISHAYAGAGAVVHLLDLDSERTEHLARELPGDGHIAWTIDVTAGNDAAAVIAEAWERRPADSVVYAAGIETTCDVVDTDWETHRRVMAVNLDGALLVAQHFGRLMLRDGRRGSFAFLASAAGKRGEAGAASYCASKFGLLGLVESFAAEVGASGIRVNAVCPGNVDTPMLKSVAAAIARREGRSDQDVLEQMAAEAAERRLVGVGEVAEVVVWLASPAASGINGESINVDAGALTG